MFVDVILPLPLYASFTYSLPADLEGKVAVGSLVLVQFGKKKFYTGLVEAVHNNPPTGFEAKPVAALLSESSIIKYPQLKLWHWISDYYLCSTGDVYKAAVPSGLKPESETYVTLNPDYEPDAGERPLTEKQALVVEHLADKKRMKITEIEQAANISDALRIVNTLLRKGIVEIDEKVVEKYRPLKTTMVSLNAEREDSEKLHSFFDSIGRSRKQEMTLLAWLDMSGFLNRQQPLHDVAKADLIKKTDISASTLKAMVDKGIFTIHTKTINRFADNPSSEKITVDNISTATLSSQQDEALQNIRKSFKDHAVTLLHGVTGSGKTEVYTHLIAEVLRNGKQVLYLVPEISLTTQLTDRLRKVFGDMLIVYHSKFNDNERVDIWQRLLRDNSPAVIIGARSSVFLPFSQLGLVIVDEEHESSFKQYDPAPRYNARDTAIVLASMHGAKTLLGSATPSIETYYKALDGKFGLVEMLDRYYGTPLPDVEIVDMKKARKQKNVKGILSGQLRESTTETLKHNRQVIMFQNRRGFAPFVVCTQCGWTPKCRNCDVSLVYHKHINQLRCHYCSNHGELPTLCPACGENSIEIFGYGTERIAEEIANEFPQARVSRMDLDTTRNKNGYQQIIEEFSNHDTDILVGTQMVTKGLDFAEVDVVGVLNADSLMNFPDYRSNERTFNMLEQVAGRAGRKSGKGKVLIQATRSDDEILRFVKNHDYQSYYKREISDRKKLTYPPFSRIINIYIKHKDQATTDALAVNYALALRNIFGARVLGPERPFVSRIANWNIQSIMLKIETAASMSKVKAILRTIYESMAQDRRMKQAIVYYDVDPA